MHNDFFSIINKPWWLLDSEELKIYSIYIFILGFVGGIILSILISVIPSTNIFFTVFSLTVISALMAIFTYKRDWFDRKYGLVSKYHIGMNYAVVFYIIGILNLGLSLMFFYPNLKISGPNSAVIMFLSQQIPLIFMLLRLNVFDDENCRVQKEDEMGNIHYENTLGYNPVMYYFIGFPLSILIGICLNDYAKDILVSSYFTSNLLQSIFSIAILFVLLSPDLLDKILPFNLRSWNGTIKLYILIAVILVILRIFII